MRGLVESGMVARAERQDAEQRLRLAKRPQFGRTAASEDHPEIIAAQRALDATIAEQARLSQHEAVISATFHTRGRLVDKVERFLRDAASRGFAFAPAVAVEPKVQKGESILDAIERVRRQARTITADLHTIASAPTPSGDAKRRMREQIEAIASMGRPNVSGLIEDVSGKIAFAEISRQTLARGETPAYVGWTEPDTLALTVWLHKDELIARLDAELTEEAADDAALSEIDRARRTKDLQGDAGLVARQLAALIWKARADGLTVESMTRARTRPQCWVSCSPSGRPNRLASNSPTQSRCSVAPSSPARRA